MALPRFTKRFFEQAAVTAGAAFCASLASSGMDFSRASLAAAVGAAARVVYGILVKPVGDTESPSAVK